MKLKDIFRSDDRAVSPVIGVILMVAITVILAAVIGTFVLGLGDSVNTSATAGVTYDQSGSAGSYSVTVTVTSLGSGADHVECNAAGGSFSTVGSNGKVGDSKSYGGSLSSGDKIVCKAIGSGDTKDAVVSTYTVE